MDSLATLPTEILEMIVARSDARSCAAMAAVSSDMYGAFYDAIPDKIREIGVADFVPVFRFIADISRFMARRQGEVSIKTECVCWLPAEGRENWWIHHELGTDEHDEVTRSLAAWLAESQRPEFGEWRIATVDDPDKNHDLNVLNIERVTTLSTEWNGTAFEMVVHSFREDAYIGSMRFGGLRVGKEFYEGPEGEPGTLEEMAFDSAWFAFEDEWAQVWYS